MAMLNDQRVNDIKWGACFIATKSSFATRWSPGISKQHFQAMICPAIAIHWGLHEEIMPGVGTGSCQMKRQANPQAFWPLIARSLIHAIYDGQFSITYNITTTSIYNHIHNHIHIHWTSNILERPHAYPYKWYIVDVFFMSPREGRKGPTFFGTQVTYKHPKLDTKCRIGRWMDPQIILKGWFYIDEMETHTHTYIYIIYLLMLTSPDIYCGRMSWTHCTYCCSIYGAIDFPFFCTKASGQECPVPWLRWLAWIFLSWDLIGIWQRGLDTIVK